MFAEIITIGDEILIGQIVDTNSAWMATKLNDSGIRVKQITSISDESSAIIDALTAAQGRADIVFITGGLGPTKDDITKKTLAGYFGVGFRRDAGALENVKAIFSRSQRPMLDVNLQQADVPENCLVLPNKNGTAPGMWFEADGKIYVSMPGVPFEMMYMMEEDVIPRLKQYFNLPAIVHHTLLTAGIGESYLAELIAPVENSLPAYIKLAYLPKLGQVRLRLSGYAANKGSELEARISNESEPEVRTSDGYNPELDDQLKAEVLGYATRISDLAGEFIITNEDKPLEKVVLDLMETKGLTLSVAESCTGGYLSHLLTQHAGSSSVFLGGAVSYSNVLKQKMLAVPAAVLEQFGAVSQETVRAMAQGAIENYQSDYAIAVSGIAGPGGGTVEKPVGTVWIAVASRHKTLAQRFQFGNKRAQNIERSAINGLTMLIKLLREEHE